MGQQRILAFTWEGGLMGMPLENGKVRSGKEDTCGRRTGS